MLHGRTIKLFVRTHEAFTPYWKLCIASVCEPQKHFKFANG